MGAFKKADYYYGALLSLLMNNGMKPALFESKRLIGSFHSLLQLK